MPSIGSLVRLSEANTGVQCGTQALMPAQMSR